MVYYSDENILIRNLEASDASIITSEEIAQGWDASIDKYNMRLKDQEEGRSIALVAEYKGKVAGYINVYPNSAWGAFANMGYPEIVDFGVLEKYRRHGIGSKLMDVAEEISAKYSDTVYLGVGLHSGYGSAQRMYVKRGYIPDGSGVWYGSSVCEPYSGCCNDDELNLYFSKKLTIRPVSCCPREELLSNLSLLHTTPLGAERIKRNLSLDAEDVADWCRQQIKAPESHITRKGKNWYIRTADCEITVNACSYTIITAHKVKA